ncbi:hypothetical protein E9Q_02783 [Moraxella catarrhalis BC1]|jgi:hypothetical protein|nr:hypothetical protein E9K_02446 [Moraxella catarrhalis 103P14B1]EGE18992.1 hypothetical protein E9Q_02783 [Moraxella catarrhalis BC1]EGE26412.1 hypothetical protein E9W_00360 [Moraxella catarrhalis CO72]
MMALTSSLVTTVGVVLGDEGETDGVSSETLGTTAVVSVTTGGVCVGAVAHADNAKAITLKEKVAEIFINLSCVGQVLCAHKHSTAD